MAQGQEKALAHSLNVHGYGFQYALLRAAEHLFGERVSPWMFEVAEFPVEVNGQSTHIDFILRNKHEHFYLIGECKRTDPALSNWCFVKAPYTDRRTAGGNERIVREVMYNYEKGYGGPHFTLEWITHSTEVYRLGFEIKSKGKGDGHYGRGLLKDATAQVLRGMNGFINFVVKRFTDNNRSLFTVDGTGRTYAAFMPAIFTTARLFVTTIDLSSADLESGNVDVTDIEMEEKSWLLYHYAQSPDLKHGFNAANEKHSIGDIMYFDYTRTIPIVSAHGLRDFMSDSLWRHSEDWKGE